MIYQWVNTNDSMMTWQSVVISGFSLQRCAGEGVSDVAGRRLRLLLCWCNSCCSLAEVNHALIFHLSFSLTVSCCTHLAVFLVLAPHVFAEASGRLAGSVWRDDVVVDQSWQVSPHSGQVSTVGQPWRTGETRTDTHSWDQASVPEVTDLSSVYPKNVLNHLNVCGHETYTERFKKTPDEN